MGCVRESQDKHPIDRLDISKKEKEEIKWQDIQAQITNKQDV